VSAILRLQGSNESAVVVAPRCVQMRDHELPVPGADEVRVRLQGCGVCASSIPVWEGRPWFKYPLEPGLPGHEGWGIVDDVGADVFDLSVGQRVAFISNHAFAQFDIAPRSAVVALPEALDDEPFPGEPIGCAMNIFERSDIRADHCVAIVGGGFLGVLLTQLATHAGAEVLVLSHREHSLEVARRHGAAHTLDARDTPRAAKAALELSHGRGFDRVIECAGVQQTPDLASELAAEAGRLVIAGYHQDGLRQVNMQSWNWRGLTVVNAHERAIERYVAGIEAGIAAVLERRIDPFSLLTHRVPLAQVGEAMDLLCARPAGFMKAIVTMDEGRT
jgi:threonine dehydrogenase-like Zn-dependent dehydrogenase